MTALFARCSQCRQRQVLTFIEPALCFNCAPVEELAPLLETMLNHMCFKVADDEQLNTRRRRKYQSKKRAAVGR